MTVKKLSVYLAPESLKFLEIIGGQHNEIELNLSSSLNLAVQFARLTCEDTALNLTNNELLFCCDILNGGAHLTEFQTPDSVSISSAMESMSFSLIDAANNNYGQEIEKWEINKQDIINKIALYSPVELFVLAIATRQFWSGVEFGNFQNISSAGSYSDWAEQWTQ